MEDYRDRGGLRKLTRDVFVSYRGKLEGARKIIVLLEPGESCGEGGA